MCQKQIAIVKKRALKKFCLLELACRHHEEYMNNEPRYKAIPLAFVPQL